MEDKRASTQWNKSDISYQNYIEYIESKSDKFDLSIIDLFYIKNFKGGFATFNEPENIINSKLVFYSDSLKQIDKKFGRKYLFELTIVEVSELINMAKKGLELVNSKSDTKIDGFGISFLTTLFHFYFPKLLPILDKRVLNGLDLLQKNDLNSQKQVKNIQFFYPHLIKAFKEKTNKKSIRQIDEELFKKKFK